ncbi:hypothetical protein O6H91_Y199400 [Diphasiastrum complanatum]|nr:hypothetical protein O6H91_Y199400 [Diphasiastrum complanatum]
MDGGRQQQQEEEENGMMDQESEACEMTIDGASEDEILKHANALTREEVVRRRARRVKQLIKLYRVQYWSLLEEMRSKYRLFYLRSGKSGWRDDGEEKEGEDLREPHAPDKSSGDNIKCGVQGCKAKPLPLSVFCFSHILLEPKQQLYKPCTYLIRSMHRNRLPGL